MLISARRFPRFSSMLSYKQLPIFMIIINFYNTWIQKQKLYFWFCEYLQKENKMVHLLSISQLRILSGVLCFISIGAIVAHALIFILLMSHMDAMTVPYSLMGQGVWTGSITIGTATLLLSYSNAKSKEWI